jgi:hypothetical protein
VARLLVFLLIIFTNLGASSQQVVLEDFTNDTLGGLPSNWFNRDGNGRPATYSEPQRAEYHYQVMREAGRNFLRYEGTRAKHLMLQTRDNPAIQLSKTPVLSWDWRVHTLPTGANEFSEKNNDTAASIYVVWGFNALRVPRVVRYTWSSSQDVGRTAARNMNMQQIVVVASGEKNLGRWITFERDIVADYEQFFRGKAPQRPVAILILSDADDTNSIAKADYGRILLKSAP